MAEMIERERLLEIGFEEGFLLLCPRCEGRLMLEGKAYNRAFTNDEFFVELKEGASTMLVILSDEGVVDIACREEEIEEGEVLLCSDCKDRVTKEDSLKEWPIANLTFS